MPFTASQQSKIDEAQKRLDKAKVSHSQNVTAYNAQIVNIQPCYKNQINPASDAAVWFNLTKGPCTGAGNCKLEACKSTVDYINNNIIPKLRNSYIELNNAQANYDKVLAEVNAEVNADPETKIEIAKAEAEAQAIRLKWIFAIVVVVVVSIAAFVWFKWFRK